LDGGHLPKLDGVHDGVPSRDPRREYVVNRRGLRRVIEYVAAEATGRRGVRPYVRVRPVLDKAKELYTIPSSEEEVPSFQIGPHCGRNVMVEDL